MKTEQEIVIDRAFDAACLSVVDPEWSKQIYDRLVREHPLNRKYIDGLMALYTNGLKANSEYCTCRRDYLVENKSRVRLRFNWK